MSKRNIRPYGEEIKSGTSDSILASLFRKILNDLPIKASRFDELLSTYVVRNFRSASNIKDRSSIRSQLYKELLSDRITFKVFIKGLRLIGITNFDISINLHHANGQTTVHTKSVRIDSVDNEETLNDLSSEGSSDTSRPDASGDEGTD